VSLKITNYVSLLEHLMQDAVSAQDLAALTGLHIDTTRDFLKEMHRRKLVHIAQWDTRYNRRIKLPMYKLGAGIDQPKPKRLPSTLVTKRWRERQKAKEQFNPFYAMCKPVAVPDSGADVVHRIAQPGEAAPTPKRRTTTAAIKQQSWLSVLDK
jgi:hypothetical protein